MDIDTTANYKMGGVQQHDSVRLDPWVFVCSRQAIVSNRMML